MGALMLFYEGFLSASLRPKCRPDRSAERILHEKQLPFFFFWFSSVFHVVHSVKSEDAFDMEWLRLCV